VLGLGGAARHLELRHALLQPLHALLLLLQPLRHLNRKRESKLLTLLAEISASEEKNYSK
jgi:hypothetical protein